MEVLGRDRDRGHPDEAAGLRSLAKYPLLVVIHGGPTGVDTALRSADRTYPVERFAAKGALVLQANYRGSAGYGEKFRSLNVRNLGLGDYEDVISRGRLSDRQGLVDKRSCGSDGMEPGRIHFRVHHLLQRPV